jgi:16S rRNA (guanine527-N7)-methyltransferase
MKGKLPVTEIEQLPSDWHVSSVVPIQVPELDAERHLILLNTN